jgi:hypothetical protein
MATQTLTITNDTNDGYGAGSWDSSAPNYLSVNEKCGWSFSVTSQITSGSTITKAYLRCNTNAVFTGTLTSTIAAENADPATNTVWSGSHLADGATMLTGATTASWNCVDFQNVWMFGEADNRPADITADIQSLVNSFGAIEIGHIINIRHAATGAGGAYSEIESGGGTNQPELYIEWTPGAGSSTKPAYYYAQL